MKPDRVAGEGWPTTSVRQPVISTKLGPPRQQRKTLKRRNLGVFLGLACQRAMTLVVAPTGFGKTTLLTQWREQLLVERHLVAWLSLDGEDNDVWEFLYSLTSSLSESCPGIIAGTSALLEEHGLASDKIILSSVINELKTSAREVTIILDDYQRINKAEVHGAVSFLALRAPANLHLIVGTSSEVPLPLAHLRAHDELVELGSADLQFDLEETRNFLRSAPGLKLDPSDVHAVHEATEGWVAGLQLAAIALRGRDDPKPVIQALSGNFRSVGDYMAQSVISRIPPPVYVFLLRTSILERLEGSLCNQVAGVDDGETILKWLEAQNLFVQTLDDEGKWFRRHHLFTQMLRSRLEREMRDEIPALHARASAWFAARQLWTEAVRHALSAEQVTEAAQWAERCAMIEVENGNVRTVLTWANKLPITAVQQRPKLQLAVIWALALTFELDAANEALAEIATRIAVDGTDDLFCQTMALRVTIAAMADENAELLRLGRHCATHLSSKDPWVKQIVCNGLTQGQLFAGRVDRARTAQPSPRIFRPSSFRGLFSEVYGLCLLGLCDLYQGRLQQAEKIFARALALSEARCGRRSPSAALAACFQARVHYEWNAFELVEELLANRHDIIEEGCFLEAVMASRLTMVRIKAHHADFDTAHDLLDRTELLAHDRGWARLVAACGAERVWLWLLQNRAGDARKALEQLEAASPDDGWRLDGAFAQTQRYRLLARVRMLMADRQFEAAINLLRELGAAADSAQDIYASCRIRALLALALYGAGDADEALLTLETGLALGEAGGMLRTFVDEGAKLAALIEQLRDKSPGDGALVSTAYLDRLLELFGRPRKASQAASKPAKSPPSPATGELSPREQDILFLLSRGLTNKEIARTLLLSADTVKWHLKNIFSKLNASTRTQAVRYAQSLGLSSEDV